MKTGTLTLNEQEQQALLQLIDIAVKAVGLRDKQVLTNAMVLSDKIQAVDMAQPAMAVEETEELSK